MNDNEEGAEENIDDDVEINFEENEEEDEAYSNRRKLRKQPIVSIREPNSENTASGKSYKITDNYKKYDIQEPVDADKEEDNDEEIFEDVEEGEIPDEADNDPGYNVKESSRVVLAKKVRDDNNNYL